ncbi:hypothetical protein PCANC_17474 [Puccinia coronata f. sp. avenae]|uniref:Uncharacterized protein n=1 Tax=Puccinia coronata f. sp. avenae TaxID=200324 RepID=A0A2N5SMD9_9BASI|nr:hypothetical protein PCANC_17474 [Puccinia coronata f. sp. avenae]PLW41823.1 hypothetical protein PCASD_05532 [Puccinia coronata f. sp. avenae]
MSSELDQLIQHSHQITIQLHNTLQQIQTIYHHPRASPSSLAHSIQTLIQQLARFHQQLRASGLGALPANTHQLIQPKDNDNDDDQQDGVTTTLLQRLEAHFQAIYHHRQIQRDAANIVRGVTSSTTSAPPPANPSSSIIMSSQKNITVTPAV